MLILLVSGLNVMNGYERDANYLALALYITWAITGNSTLEPIIGAILLASFLAADFLKNPTLLPD